MPISLPNARELLAIVLQPGRRISIITSDPACSGPNLNTTPEDPNYSDATAISTVSSSNHLPITSFISSEMLNFLDLSPTETAVMLCLFRIDHAVNAALKGNSE